MERYEKICDLGEGSQVQKVNLKKISFKKISLSITLLAGIEKAHFKLN